MTDVIALEGIFEYDALEEHAMNFLDTLSARSAMSVLTIDRIIKSVLYQYEKALFSSITDSLDDVTKAYLDGLLIMHSGMSWMSHISRWMRGVNASNVAFEVEKLNFLKLLNYPPILSSLTSKHLKRYYRNILSKYPSAIKDIPDVSKYAQLVIFCFVKRAEISDRLADILINITHKIFTAGVNKSRLKFSKLKEVKKNYNAKKTLKILVNAILDSEDNIVKDAIYPKFAKSKLIEIKQGLSDSPSETFEDLSYGNTRSSFVHYYRKIIVPILEAIEFDSDNKDMIRALELIKMNINKHEQCYTNDQEIAFENVVKRSHRKKVLDSKNRINRIDLELCALHKLRNKLRVKEVWIRDGCKYRNPAYDLPQDFDEKKSKYFSIINATEDVDEFIVSLKNKLRESLSSLNDNLPKNHYVQILKKPRGHVKIAKLSKQEPPPQLELIKSEVFNRWPCTSLLDVLKETDLFVNFTGDFVANGTKIGMSQAEIQKRLLLIILGYGTNTGLKSMSNTEISYQDLQYIKLRYLEPDNIQKAIRKVVNSLLEIRFESLWDDHTTSVASDSKHFETSKQNLLSSWHPRYHSNGVMIYWHVDTSSVCIYSQLKSCTSSEVAAMLEGILKHGTDAKIEKNYVDSHGASEVGFAFSYLFNFSLLPRYKNIHKQKLYYICAEDFKRYENLSDIMIRPINFELIKKHYDYIIKHAVALKLGS